MSELEGSIFDNAKPNGKRHPLSDLKTLIPCTPQNFYCAGLNYQAHIDWANSRKGGNMKPPAKADIGYRSPNALIARHPVFEGLDTTELARRRAFVALFETPLDDKTLGDIRSAVRQGWALGSKDFLDQLEMRLGRSARPPKRGRPFKRADADEASQEMLI